MIPISWTDTSISGAEGLDDRGVVAAIDAGARVIKFDMVASLALSYYVGSHLYLVRPGESVLRVGALPTGITLLVGWWGIAVVYVPVALWRNLRGGVEMTRTVRAHRLARAEAAEARARAEAEALAAARSGTAEERQAAAQACLARGDAETAYSLVDDALGRGSPLDRDLTALRRLLTGLHDRKVWSAAGRVATVLAREFPDEARTGYLGTVVRRVTREVDAGTPDRHVPPLPAWQTPRGFMALLSVLMVLAAFSVGALNLWIRDHRTVHVVNGTQDPVEVEVAGADPPTLALKPGARGALVVKEGELRTRVRRRGAEAQRVHALHGDFFERFRPGVVVLNVEGAALLLLEEVVYAGSRARHPPAPGPPLTLFGEELVVLPWVHHAFKPFPSSVSGSENDTRRERRLDVLRGTPIERVTDMPDGTPEHALDFLELHLRLAPDDAETLAGYVTLAEACEAGPRAAAFLAGGGPAWREAAQRLTPR